MSTENGGGHATINTSIEGPIFDDKATITVSHQYDPSTLEEAHPPDMVPKTVSVSYNNADGSNSGTNGNVTLPAAGIGATNSGSHSSGTTTTVTSQSNSRTYYYNATIVTTTTVTINQIWGGQPRTESFTVKSRGVFSTVLKLRIPKNK